MFSLCYVSSATKAFSKNQLTELLVKCRRNNEKAGVTGMLLYKDGNFMQVLEGAEAVIRQLFKMITDDPRHKGIIILEEREIELREFASWSMGFQNLNDPFVRDIPGYSEFLNMSFTSLEFQHKKSAHKLLGVFHRMHDR